MYSFVCAAGLAAGASAALLPRAQQCTFPLTASGGASGQVGQLSDGQNRIGGSNPAGSYSISNGGLTDSQGRGCILTPPTTQFQCDEGATPTTGFSIGSNGQLEHAGSTKFYACPASDNMYNIYTTPVSNQDKCVEITLSTGGKCTGSGSGSGGSSSQPPSYSQPASSSAASSAPAYSSASQPATTPKAPSYSQPATSSAAPSSSAPGYGSSETSPVAPSYSQPATSSAPSSSAPGYGSGETSPAAPSYSQPATSAAPSSSAPGYGGSSVAQSSSKPKVTSTVHSTVYHTTMNAPAPSSSQAPSGTAPAGSGSASGSACQTSLTGAYQTPHLIVPVNSAQPDKAYGTQYNATISSQECTIFNFDIPQSYQGKSCSTVFLFPEQSQLETSSYSVSGSGELVFSELSSAADQQTCWSNAPSKKSQIGSVAAKPGNSYAVGTESCAAGTTQSIEVCSTGGLSLEFFEDWNPSPIGVYITSC